MSKAVRFDDYGGVEVLEVRDVARPEPGPDQVLVAVRAAGINPSEGKMRAGLVREIFPATFPSGEGSDLAGVVEEVGAGVTGVAVGDEVIGYHQQPRKPRRVRARRGGQPDGEACGGPVGGGGRAVRRRRDGGRHRARRGPDCG